MRELHGVMHFDDRALDLKKRALLFDRFSLWYDGEKPPLTNPEPSDLADLAFLQTRNVVNVVPDYWTDYLAWPVLTWADNYAHKVIAANDQTGKRPLDDREKEIIERDSLTRALAGATSANPVIDQVPICEWPLPSVGSETGLSSQDILRISLDVVPSPDDGTDWEDILNFRAERRDKQWDFRRFLRSLATKDQTEAEVRDDIEWSLNEYSKAMTLHRLKTGTSFVEVYLIPAIEIAENLAKFNWSKIAKGALSVKRRKIELLEAEMNAPGRECAYVFDAKKRFGGE